MNDKLAQYFRSPSTKIVAALLTVLFLIVFNLNHRTGPSKAQQEFDLWANTIVSGESNAGTALPSFRLEIISGESQAKWILAPDGTQKTGERILRLLELSKEADVFSVSENDAAKTKDQAVRVGIEASERQYSMVFNKETVKNNLKIGLLLRLIKEYGSDNPDTFVSKNLSSTSPQHKQNIQ